MKKLIILFAVITLAACKHSNVSNKTVTITSTEVKETVAFLASDDQMGRATGTRGIDASSTYIENKLKSYNIKPYYKTYRDSFKVKDLDAYNVVGFLEGTDPKLKDEVIIIGAHYDHIGTKAKPVENDSIANGANDNAAGTSAVLAAARYFGIKKSNKRSLMFVLFSAEEMGLLGSKHLAQKLKNENLNLYTVVNIEMVGAPMNEKDFIAYLTGHNLSNMSEKFNEYSENSNFIGFYEMAETYNLFKRSDNYPFFEAFNVPAQTLATSDEYKHYHQVSDEVDKLDYEHMAGVINMLITVVEKMSTTPSQEIKMTVENE